MQCLKSTYFTVLLQLHLVFPFTQHIRLLFSPGKVTGNTIFNVLRLGEVETGGEGGDRPLEELKIKGIEVLWNPFDDIVPR